MEEICPGWRVCNRICIGAAGYSDICCQNHIPPSGSSPETRNRKGVVIIHSFHLCFFNHHVVGND